MKKILVNKLTIVIVLLINNVIYAKPVVSNLAIPVSYFVDHVLYLKELTSNLEKYRKTSVVAISGVGKTQLARMYAHENQQKYNIIWFIDCNLNIDQELLKLAKAINSYEKTQVITEDIKQVRKALIDYLSTKDKWLLVLDNNKTKNNEKIREFVEWENNGHIIFCSQDSKGLPHIITLKPIKLHDSKELARFMLIEPTPENIDFLAQEFKGYPVLIVQGAQILNNTKGLSNDRYKKMIQEENNNKIKLNVELSMKELPSSANELLRKISLINNQSFSKSLLSMMTSSKDTLDEDIYQLSRFALISDYNNGNVDKNNALYEMHDVIAETIQEINGREQNKKYIEEIISDVLEKSFPKGLAKRHIVRTSPTINESLQILLKNAEKFNINIYKILELRLELFGTSVNSGHYEISKVMIKWFEEKETNKEFQLKQMNNHEKYVYAYFHNAIGYYNLIALSDPVNAHKHFTRAKEIISIIHGYENLKFNISYQLFNVLLSLGQIKDADEAMNTLFKIHEEGIKNNTIDKVDIAYLYGGTAKLLLAQGKYEEALKEVDKCIEVLKENNFKAKDKFLGSVYQIKVEILNHLGRYDEAYTLAEWCYNEYISNYPSNHEIFANLNTQIAVAQYGQKKFEAALVNANKAISILIKVRNIDSEKIQFTKDIQLAKALMVKADCLSVLGFIDEALSIYEKAEAIHNNIYIGHLGSSISLKHILFEATKTACKEQSELNKFRYEHFYGNLRSIFGINIPEVKEIEDNHICKIYDTSN